MSAGMAGCRTKVCRQMHPTRKWIGYGRRNAISTYDGRLGYAVAYVA